jgi:endogenous inhibitor of DNA gyrase (YacG/DUF329 family)
MTEEREAASKADASGSVAAADKQCHRCGDAIETSDWYPVTTERGPDGSLQLYPFCSAACQDEWRQDAQG